MKTFSANYHILIVSTCLSIALPTSLESQNDTMKTDYYNWFDEIVGKSNSGIFKGIEYFERFKRINDRHQYFKTYNFRNGSVVFDGQYYFNIPLKYDVFDEKLLIKDPNTLNAPIIALDNSNISEFTIDSHKFIQVPRNEKNEISGFFEILLEKDSLSLYKKHLKEIIKKSDEKVAYLDKQVASYQFKDKHVYIVSYKDIHYKVKKASDLSVIFIDHKTEIKTISKKYKAIRKSDPDGYMNAILTDLHTIITTKTI